MGKKTMFALKDKRAFQFSLLSLTEEELGNKVKTSFSSWKGLAARGNNLTIEDYMKAYDKVRISVETLD